MNELKQKRQFLRDHNKKFDPTLRELREDEWPPGTSGLPRVPLRLWRSRDFLVQLYRDPSGKERLSICRTSIDSTGRWKDGIRWEELQRLKGEAGFADVQAVEIYPPSEDVVNDANIRHLFLMREPLPFAWTKDNAAAPFPCQ